MRHWQYPKIHERSDSTSRQGGPWIATEKIHGAQLVIATDGRNVRFGKRKAWLHDDEPFFGWQMLRAELEASVRRIHSGLGAPGVLRLFGELFGGSYPNTAVPAIPGMTPVQTGIWYAPRVSFALFDILVQEHEEDEGSFLAHDEIVRSARPLFKRPVIKRKIPEFDEQRFDESRPWDQNKTFNLEEFIALASHFINGARIASAKSKVGDSTPEAVLDILTDFEAMFPRALSNLAPKEEEHLLRRLLDKMP